ncbi:MAG: DUF4349 domain-containing protein [Planctomycetota bacterium]
MPQPSRNARRLAVALSALALAIIMALALATPSERLASRAMDEGPTPSTPRVQPLAAMTVEAIPMEAVFQTASRHAGNTRLIARIASLHLRVADIRSSAATVARIAETHSGRVASSHLGPDHHGAPPAELTLEVPADQLTDTLNQLRSGVGEVHHDTLSSQDVTDQAVDIDARLKNLSATEAELRGLLTEARSGRTGLDDVLAVQRELRSTREQIERLTAQREHLTRRVALSQITVTLSRLDDSVPGKPFGGPGWTFADTWSLAQMQLISSARWSTNIGLYAAVTAGPYLLVIALFTTLAWIMHRRSRSRRHATHTKLA